MERRQNILVVDDSEMNRAILTEMLEADYNILEAEDGVQAVHILQERSTDIDIVLLDIVMPNMDGFAVLAVMNGNRWIEDIPVIMISAETASDQVMRAYEMGVADFITRPFNEAIVRQRLNNTILLYAKQKKLVTLVNEQIREKEQRSSLMIDVLSHIVEFRNGESGLHILHVRQLTELLLEALIRRTDRYHLSTSDIAVISTASALHDIGKIAIDDGILNKPGKLTDEEFAIMKTHTVLGAQILEEVPIHADDPLLAFAHDICRWHHERFDGRGYPDGLKGDNIPISAQVVALADVYDALTSDRVYKKALTRDVAVQMIYRGESGSFNPLLLECLEEASSRFQLIRDTPDEQPLSTWEIQAGVQELLNGDTVTASERTLRQLEYERMKSSFFTGLTEEIQFEYNADHDVLVLSPKGARRLGLEETILEPGKDETLLALLGPGKWEELNAGLRATTPKEPRAEFLWELTVNGEPGRYRIMSRSVWSASGAPRYEGALGKLQAVSDID